MHIHELTLKNFCCFENETFKFSDRFNLLIGDNATGKTSILDGLAIAASGWFLGIKEGHLRRKINLAEVRFISRRVGETFTEEQIFPVTLSCVAKINNEIVSWKEEWHTKDGESKLVDSELIEKISDETDALLRADLPVVLPIIQLYSTNRLWVGTSELVPLTLKIDSSGNVLIEQSDVQLLNRGLSHYFDHSSKEIPLMKPDSRYRGYRHSLFPISDQPYILSWLKTKELQALQEKQSIKTLESVRTALLSCLENASYIWFDLAKDALTIRFPSGDIPFNRLSDGYQNLLFLIADIAIRCVTLNPGLMDRAISETPGIVLIDELDLHLHPKWQRRIVGDLMRVFPKIQFVATTHSPFVIQSLPKVSGVKLINLDDRTATQFSDMSIEDIAEDIQGVPLPSRSHRFKEMMDAAEKYYQKLKEAKNTSGTELASLKRQLDELSMPYSDDPAYQAFLKMERAASRIDESNGHATH